MTTQRPKVLLVDDDDTVLRLMARRLEPFYDVHPTGSPLHVQGLLRELQPHAVVCDIDMPGLGGGELAAAIAADPDTADIPVVFMTELATREEVDALGGVIGGHPAVSKAADMIELVQVIERACTDRRYAARAA
jgi:CheY-like chemotaxis protein